MTNRQDNNVTLRGVLMVICIIALSQWMPSISYAAATSWAEQENSKVRLIGAEDTTLPDGRNALVGGLHFELKDGWKIYWRNAGDAGLPPRIALDPSENIASVEILFPGPTRYVESWGLQAFGYSKEVVYPLLIERKDKDALATLRFTLDYMVCDEVCIPYTEKLSLLIPPDAALADDERSLLEHYIAHLAQPARVVPQNFSDPALVQKGKEPFLDITLEQPGQVRDADIFVEGPSGYGFGVPKRVSTDPARYRIAVQGGAPVEELIGQELRLTLVADNLVMKQMITPQGPVKSEQAPASQSEFTTDDEDEASGTEGLSLSVILLFAFIGGLILNVMPCVLPVLSLKLLSVLRHHEKPRSVRAGFLVTASGIVASFILLAVIAIALKNAGMAVGWGLHFQEPVFVAVMAIIMTLFAVELWGFFEIQLPFGLTDRLHRAVDASERRSPWLGHFMTGVLATLLATPCTAPFLGTAVGFALSGGTGITLLLFAVMGIGLATPYLLVAWRPRLVEHMPKPGAWMNRIKLLFGWLLFGTALWLVWIFSTQGNPLLVWIFTAVLALTTFILALRMSHRAKYIYAIVPPLMLVTAVLLGGGHMRSDEDDTVWKPFVREQIATHVADGKVVFVDVTADWCLTCKANKLIVLDREPAQLLLRADDVIAMEADWTNRNEAIGAYLKYHGRYGIPFNIVYGPAAPEGIPLSEVLTLKDVREAMAKARK